MREAKDDLETYGVGWSFGARLNTVMAEMGERNAGYETAVADIDGDVEI